MPRDNGFVIETAAPEGIAEAIGLPVAGVSLDLVNTAAAATLTVEDDAQRLLDEALARQDLDTSMAADPRVLRTLAGMVQAGVTRLDKRAA
jgi:hypothetical protein